MASPHNIKAGMQRAGRADVGKVKDPGDGNSINPGNYDRAFCVVTSGTTRSLVSASRFPLSTKLLVISQTSTITVNSIALADGEFAEFVVTLDSSGDKQWVEASSSNVAANANVIPASAGTYEFLNSETAADAVDGILAIVSALDSAGLIDGSGITQATS